MTWNDSIITHPTLSPTEKLVFHLLLYLGGDSPQSRRQLTAWLGLSDRHLRRIRDQLQALGFRLPALEGADPQVRSGHPCPVEVDTDVQSGRTCPVEADVHVRSGHPGPLSDVHVRSFNAYARTPSTSSSEEVTTLPSFQEGRKEKLAVPEGDPAEGAFSAQFTACWQDLAPGCAPPSRHQLKALQKDVGGQLPLTVARYFLMAGRRLSGLKNPAKAWNYFCRACLSEARAGRFLVQASPTEPLPPPAPSNRSLAELYLQKRSRT